MEKGNGPQKKSILITIFYSTWKLTGNSYKANKTHLERERLLLSCLRREGLGDPEELLELELREVLELPERLEAEEELEPLLEPVLELDPELEVELERDLLGVGQ